MNNINDHPHGFNERHEVEPTVDFPFHEIDGQAEAPAEGERMSPEQMDAVFRMNRKLWDWVLQGGMRDVTGTGVRATVAAWVFVNWVEELSLTELAKTMGCTKQNPGKWVDDFKLKFPGIKNKHMQ